jgi:glycosyltransferase involved in cell wall biosynthesis
MKINFTMMSTSMSGGARAIYEIINELSDRGHDITITALQGDHSWFPLKADVTYVKAPYIIKILNPINKFRKKDDFEYSSLGGIFEWFKTGFDADLVKPLSQITPDCDINVATWFSTSFAVYRSEKGIPFYFFQDFEEIVEPLGPYYVRMFKESLYLPLHIITGSQWLKNWIKEEYSKDAIVSNYGIDHTVFHPRQKDVLGDIPEHKVMAIVRGGKYKGDSDLIKALNIVSEKMPNITLIAVGNKNILQELKDKNGFNFNYRLFERPDDDLLADLYSSSDLFVFPSHKEGFGLPPLEAMACGTPVVTTDCLGVRDFVVDKENALFAPVKDPDQLAECIHKLLTNEDLGEKFKANGIKTAKKFIWSNVVDLFENAFIHAMESSQQEK